MNFLSSPWKTFAYALKPYRIRFSILLILIISGNILGYLMPLFMRDIVDVATAGQATDLFAALFKPFAFLAGALILEEICFRTAHLIETFISPNVFARITSALYESVIKRPSSYFENRFSGDLGRRIEQVSASVVYFLEQPWTVFWIVLAFTMAAINLGTTHVYVLTTFLVWLTLFVATSIPLVVWHHKVSEEVAGLEAQLSGTVIDSLTNSNLIHVFGAAGYEQQHTNESLAVLKTADRKVRLIFVLNKLQCGISLSALAISLIYVSVVLMSRGQFTVGEFALVGATLPSLTGVIWMFGESVVGISRRHASFTSALAALEKESHQLVGGAVNASQYPGYPISFENVGFQYPGTASAVFERLSLEIRPGEKVGIVGTSGAGKSTLIKLLMRQHEYATGKISIANVPIRDFSLDAFHKLISYVPQDTSLFHRSLLENIRYAKLDASEEEVVEASRKARADSFIRSFPEGYQTKVGERGVKLSGGQRQRVALARAILRNAPVLVLDEATSSLDTESEQEIQDALTSLFQSRTVIAIAHRLSTLRAMDRIIVLSGGLVVEDGNPQELLKKEGSVFKKMWDQQKNGFIA